MTVTKERLGLPTDRKPVGETIRKAGLADFVLRGLEVVFDPALLDHLTVDVEDAIGGAPIAIARLTDAAAIDEISFPRCQNNLPDGDTADVVISRTKAVGQWVWPKKQSGVIVKLAARSRSLKT